MKKFNFHNPSNLNEVVEILGREKSNAKLIAGGTDLVLELNRAEVDVDNIINIKHLAELNFIKEEKNMIIIGANTPFTTIEKSPLIKKHATVLVEACSKIGSPQIRNAGTPAGNIVTGSACADSVNALMVLDAVLIVRNIKGERTIKLMDFYRPNPNQKMEGCYINLSRLKNDEIITEIQFEKSQQREFSAFRKIGRRKALAKSMLTVSMTIVFNEDGSIKMPRIALGAVGRHPYRVESAEDILKGHQLTESVVEKCLDEISNVVFCSIKNRASCAYKKEGIKGAARDVISAIMSSYLH